VALKYVRPVIKRLDTEAISAAPAPQGVLEGSRADVSFLAGLLQDKFDYYLPLNRQHRRLHDSGIAVSRPWLTQLASRVKAMDETTIKAGRNGPGKKHTGHFWPVYGELDEVCFPFFPSRAGRTCLPSSARSIPPVRCC
jgi:hypothetical protein